jgi:hypothetical protein
MSSSENITLTHPEDWEQWLAEVRAVADKEIWSHIDPDAYATDSGSDDDGGEQESEDEGPLAKPVRPQIGDFDQNANTYAQLSMTAQKAYDHARKYYDQDLKYFHRQQDLIREVRKYISTHVSPQKKLLLDPKRSVGTWLVKLKQDTKPSQAFMTRTVHQQYTEALKGLSKTTKINQWIDKWEHAMKLARKYKLPQASNGIWLIDIAQAIRPLSDTLYMTYADQANDPKKSKSSHYPDVARKLREAFHNPSRKPTLTVRGSTFNVGSPESPPDIPDQPRRVMPGSGTSEWATQDRCASTT